jgi:hypothetical protein
MSSDTGEGEGLKPPKKRARRQSKTKPPVDLNEPIRALQKASPTPTERLAEMTGQRITALDEERKRLLNECEKLRAESRKESNTLRAELALLKPELARIRQAYDEALSHNNLSSIFLVVGSGVVSAASLLGPFSQAVGRCYCLRRYHIIEYI